MNFQRLERSRTSPNLQMNASLEKVTPAQPTPSVFEDLEENSFASAKRGWKEMERAISVKLQELAILLLPALVMQESTKNVYLMLMVFSLVSAEGDKRDIPSRRSAVSFSRERI